MNNVQKILWFISRPKYFFVFFEIIKNKIFFLKKKSSINFCKSKKVSYRNFKKKFLNKKLNNHNVNKYLDFKKSLEIIKKNKKMLEVAQNYGKKNFQLNIKNFISKSGASNINLLYEIIKIKKPRNIIETGVAYGWSSYAILLAINHNKFGKLISIDLPYPLINEKKNIGVIVPKNLKKKWTLIFDRDFSGIKKALKKFNYKVDLFHYDSDKNYEPKLKNLQLIWNYISNNGVIICDDINDNYAFFDFVKKINKKYFVLKTYKKYVGVIVND